MKRFIWKFCSRKKFCWFWKMIHLAVRGFEISFTGLLEKVLMLFNGTQKWRYKLYLLIRGTSKQILFILCGVFKGSDQPKQKILLTHKRNYSCLFYLLRSLTQEQWASFMTLRTVCQKNPNLESTYQLFSKGFPPNVCLTPPLYIIYWAHKLTE